MKGKYGLDYDKVYTSNKCGEYRVLSASSHLEVVIEFVATGTIKTVMAITARSGNTRDRLHPTFFGVGSLGYGKFKTRAFNTEGKSVKTKEYQKWENMLARCYYEKTARYSAYGGIGVKVCDEWLNFQNFALWFKENYVEGYHLDKDILQSRNKIYCPKFCRFVPQRVNGLLVNNTVNGGKVSGLPEGVSPSSDKGYNYQVGVSCTGGVENRQRFVLMEDAMSYYKAEKTRVVNEAAENNKHLVPEDIYEVLRDYQFSYEEGKL